jgi:hypothetical protein
MRIGVLMSGRGQRQVLDFIFRLAATGPAGAAKRRGEVPL